MVSFVETDGDIILNEMVEKYEKITGKTLYSADPVTLFIKWAAEIVTQQRVLINQAAVQNVPRYAEGEYLDNLGVNLFNVARQEGSQASAEFIFNISAVQDDVISIGSGTRVKNSDGLVFILSDDLTVAVGDTSVSGVCYAEVVGEQYNGLEVGSVCKVVDPYPYMSTAYNTEVTSGGADVESDSAYYERMRQSLESYSTAGAVGGYKYWALSADASITDVAVTSPSAGCVNIYVLCSDGLPGDEVLAAVESACSADDVRPLTDSVSVMSAEQVDYNIDFTYYIDSDSSDSSDTIAAAVEAAVEEYVEWQGAEMGRDVNPSVLIYKVMAAGASRVVVSEPSYTAVGETEAAVVGDVSYSSEVE